MADILNIRFEGDKALIEGRLDDVFDMSRATHLLRDAVDDMADAVEEEAKRQAPEGPTRRLRLHPVDREDTRIHETPESFRTGFGQPAPGTFLFAKGGGPGTQGFRGPGGQFIKPQLFSPSVFIPGHLVARSSITVAQEPRHAIWVHEGTGIYGPRGQVITPHTHEFMWFPASRWPTARFKKKTYRFQSVLGQPANPYLLRAFEIVNGTLVPVRIELLRAQIAAET